MSEPLHDQSARSVDIAQALRVLRDRKWVIVGLALLGFVGALVQSTLTAPQYQATAKILRQNTTLDRALFGAQIFQISDQERALITGADLVKIDQVAGNVKAELGSSRSAESLLGMITVRPNSKADIIEIVASSSDIAEPAAVANSFARQFTLYRQEADRAVLADARAQLEAKLEAMTEEEAGSAGGQTISQKVEELAVLESMQTGGYELVQVAKAPAAAYNMHPSRNAAVGLFLGLIVGVMIAAVLQVLDRRIKDEDGFEREFGVPIIATVPLVGRGWRGGRGKRSRTPIGFSGPGASTVEAFRTLRSNLKFFEVEKELRTILVTSPLPREGKSVTATNLALSLAMSGSRVILLEADLRRPMLDTYLDLDSSRGFTDLLSGSRTIDEVVQVVGTDKLLPQQDTRVGAHSSNGRSLSKRDFLCIAAGPLPPNPAELLAMDRTTEVLRALTAICDHVVIDAPPVLLVSDAAELAKKVNGVILVARFRATRTDEARRTRQSLERIGVKPLGVVVTGARGAKAYYHRYGDYYATQA